MEYQIEDSLRFFGSSLPKEEQDRLKEFMTIKNKIDKNQMDRKMLQEKKAKELLKKNRISNLANMYSIYLRIHHIFRMIQNMNCNPSLNRESGVFFLSPDRRVFFPFFLNA